MELLVHVAAPSARRDDDRYKRLAQAYSAFESATAIPIQTATSPDNGAHHDEALKKSPIDPLNPELEASKFSPSLFLEDTQLARSALESQLLTSSLGHELDLSDLASRSAWDQTLVLGDELSQPVQEKPASRSTQVSLKRPRSPSLGPSTTRHPLLMSSPVLPLHEDEERVLGFFEQQFPCETSPSKHPQQRVDLRLTKRRRSTSSSKSDDIPSQLPSTYSLSDIASFSHQREDIEKSSPAQVGPCTPHRRIGRLVHPASSPIQQLSRADITAGLSHGAIRPSPRAEISAAVNRIGVRTISGLNTSQSLSIAHLSSGVVQAVQRNDAQSVDHPETSSCGQAITSVCGGPLLRITESTIAMPPPPRPEPKAANAIPVNSLKPGEVEAMQTLSMSIYPEPPQTSSKSFLTHITPVLDSLYKDPNMTNRYRPKRIVRPPCQSERGHWLLDLRRWSAGDQVDFWRFLEKKVGSGLAGWGVWCTRELDGRGTGNDVTTDASAQERDCPACIGKVKIMCWGEVVQHVYLMLFVASKAQIRHGSAVWIDADGEVVVQM
ncbi:hypothetical protein BDV97DRAFT_357546 [Delphinella strobiligena]|nr:hypothetical protein BDV97DRAFT_357546 [Delphinella strobiligena]